MGKITKPSIAKKKPSKKPLRKKQDRTGMKTTREIKAYYGQDFWNTAHMTEPVARAMADDLFDWVCKNPDTSLTMRKFFKERGIPPDMFRDWCKKFPYLSKTVTRVKGYIGDNREMGMLQKKLSEKGVMRTMNMYQKEWKVNDEWWAELSSKQQNEIKDFVFRLADITSERKNKEKE